MKFRIYTLLLSVIIIQSSCSSVIRPRKIQKLIERSEVLSGHFTGFALYDPADKKMIAEQFSDKYFTPASNTKLFTFYTGLKLLKDSIPALKYIEKGDSLIFWGTADPTFLHPDFKQTVLSKLAQSGKKLFWANGNYTGDFYGTGWSYDDYNEYYQPEISALPVYGNIIRSSVINGKITGSPAFTDSTFVLTTDSSKQTGRFRIKRQILNNIFTQPAIQPAASFTQEIPFKTSDNLLNKILKSNLPNYVGMITYTKPEITKTFYNTPKDSVIKHMLLPSDNFIAEHLLLNSAAENNWEMNTDTVIKFMVKNYLSDLPDKPQWVDGSGLSRQNLFSPRDMVHLCQKLYETAGSEERLFNLLPQGGKSGTLKSYFKSETAPFVFAKTGTLSNNVNLTGYLKTENGKTLIFSFMNNNYVRPTTEIRKEMERILTIIHHKY
ncbi:D-alanyl-D-alanine carboxypeptidase/D-alanyl-D-alanine-endopeptidase [Daejeonella oryzae]|uniref:D-alanyl-D-alanine carboxypeptidase/D-alanyl-D-alanine-endopeptidase n=1 Tax=Daejeonella oryzae TaxID=1122943 RepID=UPI00040E8154|nr:D-alanyl-D-alanine carboxypeptidase [Daejeonella oryzae]